MTISINVISELERFGVLYEVAGGNELKCKCPFHNDEHPSCFINVEKQEFKCHTAGCEAHGDLITYLARLVNTTRRVIVEDLKTRYVFDDTKTVDAKKVDELHARIWDSGPFIKELYKRGISDDTIRKYRLGFDGERVIIPIKSQAGAYVNLRKYLPGAPGNKKMRSVKSRGKIALYPFDQLKYQTVIICGGEMKALAVAQNLNEFNIGAVTSTGGESNWDDAFTTLFKDKNVLVCFDIDDEGVKAAQRLCARMYYHIDSLKLLSLPLDIKDYPHGDVNDYFGVEKLTAQDFLKLVSDAEYWEPSPVGVEALSNDILAVNLREATKAEHVGKRLQLTATVGAIGSAPYVVPKVIECKCSRDSESCGICPIFGMKAEEGQVKMTIHPESASIIEFVDSNKSTHAPTIMGALSIPICKKVAFNPVEFYNIEDVRLRPTLNISNRAADDIMQPAFCISHNLELNVDYTCIGRMYPHPKTQESILLISEVSLTQDALSNYKPEQSELEALNIFKAPEDTLEGLQSKLDSIYADFAANVTQIYERQALHFAIDLSYHSCLTYSFDDKVIKGWVEVLIVGDSAQGKTETAVNLKAFYGLGEKMDCKNASVAGLLGGLQQLSTRWFVTWGVLPTHDKMLVILEELKGAKVEVISKLTDMRSSGIAEIPKIEKRRTHARTRIVALSNPRSDRAVSTYSFGIEVIKELIGSLEDIRRFDFALLVSSKEIEPEKLNFLQTHRPKTEHQYTCQLSRRLILWAWTRQAEDIIFDDKVSDLIVKLAIDLCKEFDESIPLVDKGGMRYKLARMSIAVAVRVFSTDDTLQKVVVKSHHVQYVYDFIYKTYSSNTFGYKDYSAAIKATNSLLNPEMIQRALLQTPFPRDVCEQLVHTYNVDLRDLMDWCGWERTDASALLSLLVRKHALQRDGYTYKKTAPFIELLKELLLSKDMKTFTRPEFINEEL